MLGPLHVPSSSRGYATPTHPTRIDETSIASPATPQGTGHSCEVETNLDGLLVAARVLHEQGDLDAVVDV